jgi:hypothetical protein
MHVKALETMVKQMHYLLMKFLIKREEEIGSNLGDFKCTKELLKADDFN